MHFLAQLVNLWLAKIKLADEAKQEDFGKYAKDAMRFYTGPYDFMYESMYSTTSAAFVVEGVRAPAFRMSVNKVAELVQLFLPVLYHRNPQPLVRPKFLTIDPSTLINLIPPQILQAAAVQAQQNGQQFNPLSMMQTSPQDIAKRQVVAQLLTYYLGQNATESNLKVQARMAITEALIKGRGLLWTELEQANNGMVVTSQYDSVDFLQLDPDAERVRDCQWIARERHEPVHVVERKFGLPHGLIRGHRNSYGGEAAAASPEVLSGKDRPKHGKTYDVVTYYEVYSRIGLGGRLTGAPDDIKNKMEMFGDYVYLAVAKDIPFPLNLSREHIESDSESELRSRVAWHTPFHEDRTHPWPFIHFDFHEIPRKVWPLAHIRPAMGELKALQWIMSFIVGKIKNISRDFVIVDKTLEDDIKDKILNGPDLTMLEVRRANTPVKDLIEFAKQPDLGRSIWEVAAALERSFERRTGITELAQGMMAGPQMRSATEAHVRDQQLSVRPDDMANRVEDAMSMVAKSQAIAARTHLDDKDIAPIFGEYVERNGPATPAGEPLPTLGPLTDMWRQLVANKPVDRIVAEYTFTVEAGSARKPNRARQVQLANEGLQTLSQVFYQYYTQTGDSGPFNMLLQKFYKSRDWDATSEAYLQDMQQQMAAMAKQEQQGQPNGPQNTQKGSGGRV